MRLLVLTNGPRDAVGVDLGSGALLRVLWDQAPPEDVEPFDVVDAERTHDERLPFSRDCAVATDPVRVGHLRGRKAERLLRPLVQPETQPLLGSPGPTVPYWTVRPDQPSVTLVAPSSGPVVERDWSLRLRCRFRWRKLDHNLPIADPAIEETLSHPSADRLADSTLTRALGWKPERILVALTAPKHGQCEKVVAGLVPRP